MRIAVKNLGPIKQAEFSPGDLTIICGRNNSGKTYATYAFFGFLYYWRNMLLIHVKDSDIQKLLNEGSVELDIQSYKDNIESILKKACENYTKNLPKIFGSSEKHFSGSQFSVILEPSDMQANPAFERTVGSINKQLFSISKQADASTVTISLLVEKEHFRITPLIIQSIRGALNEILFGHIFPSPFIVSAERTGVAIFRNELNFARNRILEEMSAMAKNDDPFELLSKVKVDYSLPIRMNVDFTRRLEELAKEESFIAKEHPNLIKDFTDIIGGDYQVRGNEQLYYVPKGKQVKLTMDESSSGVRALLDVGFYLRHVASRGHILIVDEPELNLHPENQRRMARLFARLISIGIKVFITTHSDYIVKELNTLIMLSQGGERLKALADREHYKDCEILNPDKVKVYIAEKAPVKLDGASRKSNCQTLSEADIDPRFGIEARSFDTTIEDMNRIQEEIVWGGDD